MTPILFVVFMLLNQFAYHAKEFSAQSIPQKILETNDVLLISSMIDHAFSQSWLFDPLTGEKTPYLDLERPGYLISNFAISNGGKYLFTLDVKEGGERGYVPLGQSQITRMDLISGKTEVLFTKMNLTFFTVSPDGNWALVQFLPPDMTFANRSYWQQIHWCLVELIPDSPDCRPVDFSPDFIPRQFTWTSDDEFVYTLDYSDTLFRLNPTNLEIEKFSLPEGVTAVHIGWLSESKTVLVYENDSATGRARLFTLDMTTHNWAKIADVDFPPANLMELEPNGKRVLLSARNRAISINIVDGSIVNYYTMYDMEWTAFIWLPDKDGDSLLMGCMMFLRTGYPDAQGRICPVIDPASTVAFAIYSDLPGIIYVVP